MWSEYCILVVFAANTTSYFSVPSGAACNKGRACQTKAVGKGIRKKERKKNWGEPGGEWQMAGTRLALPHCSVIPWQHWPDLSHLLPFTFAQFEWADELAISDHCKISLARRVLLPAQSWTPDCWFIFNIFCGHLSCLPAKTHSHFLSTDAWTRKCLCLWVAGRKYWAKRLEFFPPSSSSDDNDMSPTS